MKNETKSLLFDTSALLEYFFDEDGSEKVEKLLTNVESGSIIGYISSVTLAEIIFIVGRRDIPLAYTIVAYIEESALHIVPATSDICTRAGGLKLMYKKSKLSIADAVIIASGTDIVDTFITKDPEWKKVLGIKVIEV